MSGTVYLNGVYMPKEEAKISVDDRGFVFGDGVYEVTRVVAGKLFEWPRHAARLQRSLEALGMNPGLSMEELEAVSNKLLKDNQLLQGEASVYLQITRGAAPRAHPYPANTPCTVYLAASVFEPHHKEREQGISAITFPDIRWARCDIKTVNLLPAVLARHKAIADGAYEAIFVREDVITEGAYSNVFGVVDGVVRTHPLSERILPGVTRDVILDVVKQLGLPCEERAIHKDEFSKLSELFITSMGNDAVPVVALDGKKIGSGKPGPVAGKIYAELARRFYGLAAA